MLMFIMFLLIFIISIVLCYQTPGQKIYEVHGRPILPRIDLSFGFTLSKKVTLVLEQDFEKTKYQLKIPRLQAHAVLKLCEQALLNPSEEHAEATVYYQKNIFAKAINPYLVITKKGIIPTPK